MRPVTIVVSGAALKRISFGPTPAGAKEKAYEAVEKIGFKGAHYRTDIADKALAD